MNKNRGFSLIELLIAGALILVLSTVVVPAYSTYRLHSLVPEGLSALEAGAGQLEASKKARGTYGSSVCNVSLEDSQNFLYHCQVTRGGYGYELQATGVEALAGYEYSIDQQGQRKTLRHPKGAPSQACWSVRGTACDHSSASGG